MRSFLDVAPFVMDYRTQRQEILLYHVFFTLFGLGSEAVVALASVFGSVPIMVNVRVGLVEVQPIFVKLGRSLKATQWQTFWKIMGISLKRLYRYGLTSCNCP